MKSLAVGVGSVATRLARSMVFSLESEQLPAYDAGSKPRNVFGLRSKDSAGQLITEAWHLNHYVNREVAVALGFCGQGSLAQSMIEILDRSQDLEERAFMARVLGEIFVEQRPERLSTFVAGTNYTMRNDWRLPYQKLANEFMFSYLIPAFDEKWW